MTTRRLSRFLAVLLALAGAGCGSGSEPPPKPREEPPPESVPVEPTAKSGPPAAEAIAQAKKVYEAGDYARAAGLFAQALAAEPGNSTAQLGRAWSLLMDLRARAGAGEAVSAEAAGAAGRAFETISTEDLGVGAWKVRLGQGILHLLLGDQAARESRAEAAATEYGRAEEILGAVQQTRPGWNDLLALEGLARIARFRGDHESVLGYTEKYLAQIHKSVELYREAIEHFPMDMDLWAGKMAEALPRSRPALELRAESLLALDRRTEAEAEAEKLLDLARELEVLERPAEAKDAYASFLDCAKRLDLPEHHEGVKEARSRLRALGR